MDTQPEAKALAKIIQGPVTRTFPRKPAQAAELRATAADPTIEQEVQDGLLAEAVKADADTITVELWPLKHADFWRIQALLTEARETVAVDLSPVARQAFLKSLVPQLYVEMACRIPETQGKVKAFSHETIAQEDGQMVSLIYADYIETFVLKPDELPKAPAPLS